MRSHPAKLWVGETPLRFRGIEVGHRMTALRRYGPSETGGHRALRDAYAWLR